MSVPSTSAGRPCKITRTYPPRPSHRHGTPLPGQFAIQPPALGRIHQLLPVLQDGPRIPPSCTNATPPPTLLLNFSLLNHSDVMEARPTTAPAAPIPTVRKRALRLFSVTAFLRLRMRPPPPRPGRSGGAAGLHPVSTSFPVQLFALGKPAWTRGP
ncbi:unnamed protein product [Rangifer tarandus platyrhynchus]|uniref:Uncharacterized protein n=2 Tax=Rangifer tarandus platyrhynchus TaxID=3082113 RepID=A0ACB0DYL3_RANTA|nr:unnamed protein product [Rangifer tarandus platyrhynchus]CAI9693341.1 unnamed protein product [Rangifer tarandus platyrhynchus]